jgi:hypothetical protein
MQMALVALKKPAENTTDKIPEGNWLDLMQKCRPLKKTTKDVEMLSETVWLIRLETALPVFGGLVAAAEEHEVPYRVHFLDEDAKWIGTWKSSIPSPE